MLGEEKKKRGKESGGTRFSGLAFEMKNKSSGERNGQEKKKGAAGQDSGGSAFESEKNMRGEEMIRKEGRGRGARRGRVMEGGWVENDEKDNKFKAEASPRAD